MEWIVVGLIAWWWCSNRAKAKERRAQRALDSLLEQHHAAAGGSGLQVTEGIIMAVTDGYAYWRIDGELVRAPYANGQADVHLMEPADPLTCDDLPPALVVEVLDALDAADADLRRPRTHP